MRAFSTKGKRVARKVNWVSATRFIYLTTQVAAIFWVSTSYIIALYSTIRLGQVFPVVELSQQAITTILGVGILKTVENIFEHNDSVVFGHSHREGGENNGRENSAGGDPGGWGDGGDPEG